MSRTKSTQKSSSLCLFTTLQQFQRLPPTNLQAEHRNSKHVRNGNVSSVSNVGDVSMSPTSLTFVGVVKLHEMRKRADVRKLEHVAFLHEKERTLSESRKEFYE